MCCSHSDVTLRGEHQTSKLIKWALNLYLLVRAGVEELPGPHVLRLNLLDDPLHVDGDGALLEKLLRLLLVVLTGGLQEGLLENFLVQLKGNKI